MRASNLRHFVTIEAPPAPDASDDEGNQLKDWTEVCRVWADIRLPGGLESIRAGAEVSIVRASIRIRYRSDISAAMRVVHAGVQYNVKAALPDLVRKRHIDLVCEVVR